MVPVLQIHRRRAQSLAVVGAALSSNFLIVISIVGIEALLVATLVSPRAVGPLGALNDNAGNDGGGGGEGRIGSVGGVDLEEGFGAAAFAAFAKAEGVAGGEGDDGVGGAGGEEVAGVALDTCNLMLVFVDDWREGRLRVGKDLTKSETEVWLTARALGGGNRRTVLGGHVVLHR